MIESFKILAKELKRILKLSVYLPLDYNTNDHKYNCVLMLDGQYFFNDIYSKDITLNLGDLFDEVKLNYIVIAIHSPENPNWRLSELVPFNLGNGYDNSLSNIFGQYLVSSLLPLLKERYRLNSFPALFGFGESSILAMTLIEKFRYTAIFSPLLLGFDFELLEYIKNITDKNIYIYSGNNDTKIINSTLALSRVLDSNKNIAYYLDFSDDNKNNQMDWKKYILNAIKYLME